MQDYALGSFLARWYPSTRHELAASECETWTMSELLALADADDRARWDGLALGYSDPCGADFLRGRIAEGYETLDAGAVICCAGAQEALSVTLRALVQPGDHAILLLPCYHPSEAALTDLCDVTAVALDGARGWALDLQQVEDAITPATRLLLANFPNNPTGRLLSRDELEALVALCRRHGIWLVNDEVYRLIEGNGGRLPCVADVYERGVSIDAMSKAYGLPGLRVGWLACGDAGLLARATGVKLMASLCLAGPSEVLAHAALGVGPLLLARNRQIVRDNLAVVDRFIARHGDLFRWERPEAGAVGYVRYGGSEGVESFARWLAREQGVLVLPASVWRSALAPLPEDRFRIGFGRRGCCAVLEVVEAGLPVFDSV